MASQDTLVLVCVFILNGLSLRNIHVDLPDAQTCQNDDYCKDDTDHEYRM
jgi:hypothetical protein